MESESTETPHFVPGDWVVHKFGGTSVGSADCMRKCIEIVKPLVKNQRVAVVVSAMGGKPKVTDLLLDSVHAAAADRQTEIAEKLENIHLKHQVSVGSIYRYLTCLSPLVFICMHAYIHSQLCGPQ